MSCKIVFENQHHTVVSLLHTKKYVLGLVYTKFLDIILLWTYHPILKINKTTI